MDSRLNMLGSQALLGTDRRASALPVDDTPCGLLLKDIAAASNGDDAAALLRAAGAVLVCERAGFVPQKKPGAALPPSCPEEKRAMLPENSPVAEMLGEIFRNGFFRLQREAIAYLAQRNMVLPYSLLVPALAMGRETPALRPSLSRILGERGLWLSERNSAWSLFAASSEEELDPEDWEHGRPAQRKAFFLLERSRAPRFARERFERDLASMGATERRELLALFSCNLSMEDEDLLERLLRKDRSREVKKAAADLLSRLPGSRYLERMGARLAVCLQLSSAERSEGGLRAELGRIVSAVTGRGQKEFIVPPETYDSSWAEDLISEKTPLSRLGPRAGWLYQMASAMPLVWWTKHTGRTPEELLELSDHSEWKDALQLAWGDAFLREPDAAWAHAMLRHVKKGGVWPSCSGERLDVFRLAGTLSGSERDNAWEEMLTAKNLPEFLQNIRARQEEGYTMSPSLAKRALSVMKERLSAKNWDYYLAPVAGELAALLPADMLPAAREMLAFPPESDSPNRNIADMFTAVALQREALGRYFSVPSTQ